jgi:hypothetical protein
MEPVDAEALEALATVGFFCMELGLYKVVLERDALQVL